MHSYTTYHWLSINKGKLAENGSECSLKQTFVGEKFVTSPKSVGAHWDGHQHGVSMVESRKTQGTLVSSVIFPDVINTYFQTIKTDDAYEAPTREWMWCKKHTDASETNRFVAWWVSLLALARLLSPSCTCDHQNFQLLTLASNCSILVETSKCLAHS